MQTTKTAKEKLADNQKDIQMFLERNSNEV